MVLMTDEQAYCINDRKITLRNPACNLWPLKILVVREQGKEVLNTGIFTPHPRSSLPPFLLLLSFSTPSLPFLIAPRLPLSIPAEADVMLAINSFLNALISDFKRWC